MVQINLHHCEAAETDSSVDVALIEKPWINNTRACGLRVTGSIGDLTVVQWVATGGSRLRVTSVYMPYEAADPPGIDMQHLAEQGLQQKSLSSGILRGSQ